MIFYKLTDFSQLESGYFGTPEPREDGETVSWEDAMMIMPGVAFDEKCDRVGYGGGFYDVWLKRHGSHVTACGLAYDFQLRNEIPFERHDRMMNIVITPDEVIRKGDAADDND